MIREISVSRSVRVNTGNYEGTELFVSMKAILDELDDEQEAREELNKRVNAEMVRQLLASYKSRGKAKTAKEVARQHGLEA